MASASAPIKIMFVSIGPLASGFLPRACIALKPISPRPRPGPRNPSPAANPTASILSAKIMLEHLGFKDKAALVERGLYKIFEDRENWTYDVGGNCKTADFTEKLKKIIQEASDIS